MPKSPPPGHPPSNPPSPPPCSYLTTDVCMNNKFGCADFIDYTSDMQLNFKDIIHAIKHKETFEKHKSLFNILVGKENEDTCGDPSYPTLLVT